MSVLLPTFKQGNTMMRVFARTRTHVHTHTHTDTHTHTHTRTHTHTHTHTLHVARCTLYVARCTLYVARCTCCSVIITEGEHQRGLTAKKKGVFKMWMEHGRQSLLCLSLAPRGSPCSKLLTAPELEHSNWGRTCLIFCGVDPTFHHKIFTADHPLHQMAYFRVVWSFCNKRIWLQKNSSEKMKCVVMWLNMCCFPIERPKLGFGQSRWALTPVNLRALWLTWI